MSADGGMSCTRLELVHIDLVSSCSNLEIKALLNRSLLDEALVMRGMSGYRILRSLETIEGARLGLVVFS